ncbi:hypothetical protein OAE63_00610 [bacterium]|nr:hypothetical protein [bacterium]
MHPKSGDFTNKPTHESDDLQLLSDSVEVHLKHDGREPAHRIALHARGLETDRKTEKHHQMLSKEA